MMPRRPRTPSLLPLLHSADYIHQQGGGWCESPSDCLGRSKTDLGSSKTFAKNMSFASGYLSYLPAENPMMYNWTKVYLKYCDGGSQTGDVAAPVTVGSSTIYYRGHRILRAVQAALISRGLSSATDVVISGCSAGGLSTFLHADEWAAALPAARVTAAPDSGFFLDYNNTAGAGYGAALRWVAAAMNAVLPAACVAANADDTARCIFAEHVSATLKTPSFPLQGEYDSWQLGNDARVSTNNDTAVNEWGSMLTARVNANLLNQPQHGIFLDSCLHHCGGWNNFQSPGDKLTQALAHQAWYGGSAKRVWAQGAKYPCKECCNGAPACAGAQ